MQIHLIKPNLLYILVNIIDMNICDYYFITSAHLKEFF